MVNQKIVPIIQLQCESPAKQPHFEYLCQTLGLQHHDSAVLALVQTDDYLGLRKLDESKLGDIMVDFVQGVMRHRRKFGGGRGEAVAKAMGIKGRQLPTILDATAGLGRDAFVLANIGCHVWMNERHPVVYALLQDGLARATQDTEIGNWIKQRMQLLPLNTSIEKAELFPDIVYLDPMFPHKQKSALVKKEMRLFQSLIGADYDADKLLKRAMSIAQKRVVVKRPDYAPFLANQVPHLSHTTKNHRFDIYLISR